MKRVLSVLAMFWVASASAEDSWLYWMLGDTTGYTVAASGSAPGTFTTVKVRGNPTSGTEDDYLSLYYSSGVGGAKSMSATTVSDIYADGIGLYALLASDKTYSSFVIELWNDSSFVAQSETLDMSVASAQGYIERANSLTLAVPWVGASYAVPEPNSAMLLLIGCAALGLRRRKMKIA